MTRLFDAGDAAPTRIRLRVLAFLCVMAFILYLDRICIGQAAVAIQHDLGISNTAMGVVFGAFTLAYGLFEAPTGHWGDRFGSRKVLARIVWWWSAFTMLTGLATGFAMLIVVRFLFGAGEAGALPNTARVIARWFPDNARGSAQGMILTCALLGGAVSPIIAEALLSRFGWRTMFLLLGIPGIVWGAAFYFWFRDRPEDHPAVNRQEREWIAAGAPATHREHPPIDWKHVLKQANIWLLGGVITCCSFTTYLFFSWYPTYLQQGRGLSPALASRLASFVLVGGAIGSLGGGYLGDWVIRRTGNRRRSRPWIGCASLTFAAASMAIAVAIDAPWLAAACCAGACFAVHVQLPTWWGAVTDISGPHLGALFGLMNAMGVPGAVGSQLFLGRFVDVMAASGRTGRDQWDPAFYLYSVVLLLGAAAWLQVDVSVRAVLPHTALASDD